jgi:hypothetical protein
MNRDQALDLICAHLQAKLQFPCEVTGVEDFRGEEPYVLGGWSQKEYKLLKKTQPSYRDRYQLLAVSRDEWSEWMMLTTTSQRTCGASPTARNSSSGWPS